MQLPSLQLRRWHPHGNIDGAFASVTLESLSLLRWRHRCAGTIAIVAWALSPSRCWRPCGCCDVHCCCLGAGAIACCCDGAVVPSLTWWHWRHPSCCPGAVAIVAVAALASLRTSQWRRCQRHFGIVVVAALASPLRWHCCHRCLGLVNVAVLASLQLLQCASLPSGHWHYRRCCDGPVVAITEMSSSQASTWSLCHRQRHDTGVFALVALAPLPSLPLRCWHPCGHRDGAVASVT